MAQPRKHPPVGALEDIERLAAQGHSTIGLAKFFNVSRPTIARWFEGNEKFEEAYEQGRDSYRQKLEEELLQMVRSGKNSGVAGIIYLLKSKFKMYDIPTAANKVDVDVKIANVMVVKDHGTDEEWQAKCLAQQKALLAGDTKN